MTLIIHNLDLTRGEIGLQHDLNFELKSGEALWVQGANGVGKSTLLETISGQRKFAKGQVFWNGDDAFDHLDDLQSDTQFLGHKSANPSTLTGAQTLGFYCGLYGLPPQSLDAAIERAGLEKRQHIPVAQLSAGQQRRLAIARLLLAPRKIWVLDEPTVSLDQDGIEEFCGYVSNHLKSGGLAIFTSHTQLNIDAKHLKLTTTSSKIRFEQNPFLGEDWEGQV